MNFVSMLCHIQLLMCLLDCTDYNPVDLISGSRPHSLALALNLPRYSFRTFNNNIIVLTLNVQDYIKP